MEPIWRIGLAEVGGSFASTKLHDNGRNGRCMGLVDTTAQEETGAQMATTTGWWFGTFFHILGMSSQLTFIFFKMVKTTNQMSMDQSFM